MSPNVNPNKHRFIRFSNGAELREFESGLFLFINKDRHAVRGLRTILQEVFDQLAGESEDES